MQFTLPRIGSFFTWRNGFFAVAAVLAVVCVSNLTATRSYSASPDADPAMALQGWVMSVAPGVLAAVAGAIASAMGVPPEYVAAMKAFAKNPSIAELEKRAVNAAFEFLSPRFGKYPELFLSLLRTMAPQFATDPDVAKAISDLGQALAKNYLATPPPEQK